MQGLWSIKVASGLAPCRSHGLRLDSLPSAFPARQVQLSCHTSPPSTPKSPAHRLDRSWTMSMAHADGIPQLEEEKEASSASSQAYP